tara:strand:+ start:649 stop:918 length:270 start_codon:yes stop_codon:yes gene_type:complete
MDQADREQWAKDALNNPALEEAFEILSEHYLLKASECTSNDDMGRFRYLEAYKSLKSIRRHLNAVVEVGKLNKVQANELNTKKKIINIF